MNLPNKLTMCRIFMIPLYLVFLYMGWNIPALIVFIAASLTDLADGKIARSRGLVTNFGKFMDPLADKLLTCSAMIAMIDMGRLEGWIVIIIIAREFTISGFRLVAASSNVVIAANYWGKWKTVFQMSMVILLTAAIPGAFFGVLTQIVKYIAVILTVVSLVIYLRQNWSVMKEGSSK
ncbi:MAG: CDP-diacylglycerol--glycerol-3-phosphate 3-phosphatidyltransferase [Lachnospiraceae bacterium]|nr:CDP-diacylglycerol--glycerol-3-phosphate 3-phosphatidyltransferase [Lachnospiraceae bacterium]